MRALILSIATIAAAHQIVAAQTLSDPAGVRSGGGMPANRMQIETKSSQYDVPPKFISETGHTRDFRVLNTGYLCFAKSCNPRRTELAVSPRHQEWASRILPSSCLIQPPLQLMHIYAVRPRKDHRGFDLISDALPFGRLWYLEVRQAIDFAKHQSRSHDPVIRVYDEACKLIEVHRHKGDFNNYDRLYSADCRCRIGPSIRRIQIP